MMDGLSTLEGAQAAIIYRASPPIRQIEIAYSDSRFSVVGNYQLTITPFSFDRIMAEGREDLCVNDFCFRC